MFFGNEEAADRVAALGKQRLDDFEDVTIAFLDVDPKWRDHFVARGAAVLREIEEQNGVKIAFPRPRSYDRDVTIKGSKRHVDAAKRRIKEIVADLEAHVTMHMMVPWRGHRALLANRGEKIEDISAKHNVQIKFPDRQMRGV